MKKPPLSADVLIVGGGVAGLSAALSLAPLKVLLVAPNIPSQEGSTYWAQGGISAAISNEDSPELHAEDTIAVGGRLCDESVVREITGQAPNAIQWLSSHGVRFDRAEDASLILALEAAHSKRRVCHAGGDQIGRGITNALTKQVIQAQNITLIQGTLYSLLKDESGSLVGAEIHTSYGLQPIHTAHTILATGGIGGLFLHSTNPSTVRGEGLALAALVGAELIDLEFIQFHPTALNVGDKRQKPLLTEALRGEGAEILNNLGEPFLYRLDPRGPLAPRALIAKGIAEELLLGREIFLDVRGISQKVNSHFPQVTQICKEANLNPAVDLLPIVPAAHYHMGGIRADVSGKTSINGLYAIGEVACTGFHGANRLASNSLLEGVVMGRLCGLEITSQDFLKAGKSLSKTYSEKFLQTGEQGALNPASFSRNLGIIRNGEELEKAYLSLQSPRSLVGLAQKLIINSAITRTESRGAHYRVDFPDTSQLWDKRISVVLNDALEPINKFVSLDSSENMNFSETKEYTYN